jgi:hypothetical protein
MVFRALTVVVYDNNIITNLIFNRIKDFPSLETKNSIAAIKICSRCVAESKIAILPGGCSNLVSSTLYFVWGGGGGNIHAMSTKDNRLTNYNLKNHESHQAKLELVSIAHQRRTTREASLLKIETIVCCLDGPNSGIRILV